MKTREKTDLSKKKCEDKEESKIEEETEKSVGNLDKPDVIKKQSKKKIVEGDGRSIEEEKSEKQVVQQFSGFQTAGGKKMKISEE